MIKFRQKEFVRLESGARVARNIWYRTGKFLQPLTKKTDRQIAESAAGVGRKVNRIIRQPLAVTSDVMVSFASKPLETAGMPLLVAPELVSTAIGGGMIAAGKGLRKIKPIGQASEWVGGQLKRTGLYRRAQGSTRGFHNNFELPVHVTRLGLGATGVGTVYLGRRAYLKGQEKKKNKKEQEPKPKKHFTLKRATKSKEARESA